MVARVVEIESDLKVNGSVVLDANGRGVITFSTDHANQRWVIRGTVVSTNQAANATTIPVAQLALNTTDVTTMSQGNDYGSTWSGNQDIFRGEMPVGPCDFASVLFYPPAGQSGAALAGVIARAVVTGTKYTRRAV